MMLLQNLGAQDVICMFRMMGWCLQMEIWVIGVPSEATGDQYDIYGHL